MALINKSDIANKAYLEGGRQLHDAYADLLKTPGEWGAFTTIVPTNTTTLDLGFVKDYPLFQKQIGSVAFSDLTAAGYTVTTDRYSAGIKIHEDELDDDLLDLLISRIVSMADAPAHAMENLCFSMIKAGIATTTYGACYDGQAFFNASHPVAGSTKSNYVAGGGSTAWYLLDCSKRHKPIFLLTRKSADLEMEGMDSSHRFETGEVRYKVQGRMGSAYGMWQQAYCDTNAITDTRLWTAIETMRGYTNDAGVPLGIRPTHLLVAPDTEQAARELLERYRVQGTAAAPSNEPVQGLGIQLIVSPYLT